MLPRYSLQSTPISAVDTSQSGDVDFGIPQPVVPVELWQQQSTNRFDVTGTLTLRGAPVVGARLKGNAYTLPAVTGEDGSFVVVGDKTVLERTIVRVSDLGEASVDGQAIGDAERDLLLAAQTTIESAFVMTLDGEPALTAGESAQTVSGRLTFADGSTPVPAVSLWGYHLSGIVADANGQPIEGAYVSVRDDEGETWAISSQTTADGAYVLRFYPLGGSRFIVRVAIGLTSYQSEGEVQFEDESSAAMDITVVAEEGRIVGTGADGAFVVEKVVGAEYVGYMTGLAVGTKPIAATTTWPDATGAFTIAVPSLAAGTGLTFFQSRVRFFDEGAVEPGSDIDPAVIPAELGPEVPALLPPTITVT